MYKSTIKKFRHRGKVGREYQKRTKNLEYLGFRSYPEYLKSAQWRAIRGRVLAQKGDRCIVCEVKTKQVHHGDYSVETLTGKSLERLWPVCPSCHKAAEFSASGEKRTPAEATAALRRMVKSGKRKREKNRKTILLLEGQGQKLEITVWANYEFQAEIAESFGCVLVGMSVDGVELEV